MSDREFIFWLAGFITNKGMLDHTELAEVREQLYRLFKEDRYE